MNSKEPQKDKLLDHNYDGIQELDNPLPRWWVILFYLTSIFAVIYFSYFHILGGPSSVQQLEASMAKIKGSSPAQNQSVDWAAIADNKEAVSKGKAVFDAKCASCHGAQGQGIIGPNLTDHYWIHGKGKPEDIAKVVTEGVPDKGMLAWGTLLKSDELQSVVAYVYSLRDSHPENPKAPQGNEIED